MFLYIPSKNKKNKNKNEARLGARDSLAGLTRVIYVPEIKFESDENLGSIDV